MDGIQVVIFLVGCAEGLLVCQDLPSEHLHFSSMAACQTNLPDLIEVARTSGFDGSVVMAKCRYLLKEVDQHDDLNTWEIAVGP